MENYTTRGEADAKLPEQDKRKAYAYRHVAMLSQLVFGCTANNGRYWLYQKRLFGLFRLVFGHLCHFMGNLSAYLEESAAHCLTTGRLSDTRLLHYGAVVHIQRPDRTTSRILCTFVGSIQCAVACANADKGGYTWTA